MTTTTSAQHISNASAPFDLLGELLSVAPSPQVTADFQEPKRNATGAEDALLLELLTMAPNAGTARRPVALRSTEQQRRHALRGYSLRTWVDSALQHAERLLFIGAILVFGYWFIDGPVRDWLHYQQASPVTRSAAAAIKPLATHQPNAPEPITMRDAHDRATTHVAPLPFVTDVMAQASPADDFMAPRQQPLAVQVSSAPPEPTHLLMPTIGVDTPVKEVFIVDGVWEVAEYAAGYMHGTGLPGEGNTVLAGHAGLRGAVFQNIGNLKANDDVFLDAAGWRYHYRVRDITSVWPEQVEVLDPTTTPVLTMLTCTNWDTQRLVVVADLVASKPIPSP